MSAAAIHLLNLPMNHKRSHISDFEVGTITVGLDADKPTPGVTNRFYLGTDTKILYRDTGSAWEEVLRGEAVTRLAQLSEKAHPSLTGIGTDDHHAKDHTHWKNKNAWYKADTSEVSTTSLEYVELLKTTFKTGYAGQVYKVIFCHNVKNEGTLASRGSTFKLFAEREGVGKYILGEYRWTDGLADYKIMTAMSVSGLAHVAQKYAFGVEWKVDDPSYACYSKTRFLTAESYQLGGVRIG